MQNGDLELINKCLASKNGTGCYIQISSDNNYLFEAVYGAGIARIYKLNNDTGEIENLLKKLNMNIQQVHMKGRNPRMSIFK